MYKSFLNAAAFTLGMSSLVYAQEALPLNTPLYRLDCSGGKFVAQFAYCSMRNLPIGMVYPNRFPGETMLISQRVCGVASANSADDLDNLKRAFSIPAEDLEAVIGLAQEDFKHPERVCAMF